MLWKQCALIQENQTVMKSYSEIKQLKTFEERLKYLSENGEVGHETFGFNRYLNQAFYKSKEWLAIRKKIIIRDLGCDLGVEGHDIYKNIIIHHINPITEDDIINRCQNLFDPENLICVSHKTHNMIHYGVDTPNEQPVDRSPNDTCPWKGGH